MRVHLHPDHNHYLAVHDDGTETLLLRVSRVLQLAGVSPRFGKNAQPAAHVGTALHELAKDHINHGTEPALDTLEDQLCNCWVLWREWWGSQGLRPELVERCVASLQLGYGGMLDLVARQVNPLTGELSGLRIVDYKTSMKSTCAQSSWAYPLQLAAYGRALWEMGYGVPEHASIVRVGKSDERPEIYVAWETPEEAEALMDAWEGVVKVARWRLAKDEGAFVQQLAGVA